MKSIKGLLVAVGALCAFPFAFAGGDKSDTFAKFDANGDGKITKEEHAAGAKQMFAEMDTNHDGVVTAQEIDAKHAAKSAEQKDQTSRPPMSPAEKIKEIDTNGDGKLTAEEHAAGSEKMFAKMDTNGDGTLSKEECDAGHDKLTNKRPY